MASLPRSLLLLNGAHLLAKIEKASFFLLNFFYFRSLHALSLSLPPFLSRERESSCVLVVMPVLFLSSRTLLTLLFNVCFNPPPIPHTPGRFAYNQRTRKGRRTLEDLYVFLIIRYDYEILTPEYQFLL